MLSFTILCMLVSPLLGIPLLCFMLYRSRNTINKYYAVPFALLYGTIGYNLYLKGESDLTRYYAMVDRLNGQNLLNIFSKDKDKLYTKDILFYFVSKIGNNNILAFIVGFCCYLIVFYIFFDTVRRHQIVSERSCNIHIFLIGMVMASIISPYSIIGNVRCVFSYILVSFAAYRDWIQKKRNIITLFFYIVPIGLHSSTIIILIIRIFVPFFRKFSKLFILTALLLPTFIEVVYRITSSMNLDNLLLGFIRKAAVKANYYLNWTEGGWADEIEKSISNKISRIYGTFFLLLIIMLYFMYKKDKNIRVNEKMGDFLYIIAVIALGCLSIKTGAFWRFEAIVVLFCPLILIPIVMDGGKKYKKYLLILYSSACVMFILNMIHFTRNVLMKDFFVGCINTSIFYIIWEMFKGVASILGG